MQRGEIVCIAGIDGNGQAELVHAITGLGTISAGKVTLNGEDITGKSIRRRNTQGLSHIPEDRHKHGLVLDYNLAYNLVLQQYFEPGFQRCGFLDNEEIYRYADRLIQDFDIRSGEGADTVTRSMSGGNQQKVILAREVGNAGEMLVMDQPTRGLDLGAINNIHTSILEERRKGKGILLVSTELSEIFELCDRIAVIYKGAFMGIYRHDELTTERIGLLMAGYKEGKEA